ncbi:MAG TPA: BTAD domain-containing putative transcriptional regulator [Acidimicrobiales bacterium]|nr:BTAD domain-containing putative transcriptional regulator [Acidimicrobiales bacterium]
MGAAGSTSMYGILGPLEVRVDEGSWRLRSTKQRLVLAVLLVHANDLVTSDRLVEELWGDRLPADPGAALRSQLSRLRRQLGALAEDLVTEEGGYRLRVHSHQLDAAQFEDLLAEADREAGDGALAALDRALSLWRGPALAEFADRPFAQPEAVRLDELGTAARERRAELLLGLGRLDDAVASLEGLLAEHNHRERARGLLMQALYRAGRQTDALATYHAWRRQLADATGLEPSPVLQELEGAILRHALPSEPQWPASEPPRRAPPLPLPVTSFVGRDAEVDELADAIAGARLITVCGPGGVGKTRLALEVARRVADRYRDGVRFCDLSVVRRSGGVARAVAACVGLEERAFRRLEDQLVEHLSSRHLLLVLDNCEHVLDASAAVAERLVRDTAGVAVLATARERLAVDGEHVRIVAPLACSGPDDPAVRLFVDRARALDPGAVDDEDLTLVARLCERLDGLPLAIELAAGRLPGLSVGELLDSLPARFALLTTGRRTEQRHRSLQAVVGWSYEQLPPHEQRVFRWLSVFAGHYNIDAAIAVVAGNDIDADMVRAALLRLVDRSLVNARRHRSGTRYWLLETLRTYGEQRLRDEGELEAARDRHARWAVTLAGEAGAGLRGREEGTSAKALDAHLDELRAAHGWLVGRDPERSLALVAGLHWYALWRTHSEVFRWAEVAASAAPGLRSPLLAQALGSAAFGASFRGDLDSARALAQAGLDAAAGLEPIARRRPLQGLGEVALLRGDVELATALYGEAHELSLAAGDVVDATWDLGGVAVALIFIGRGDEAGALADQVMASAQASDTPSAVAFAHYVFGEMTATDDPVAAEAHLRKAVELAEPVGSRLIVNLAQVTLATLQAQHQDPTDALRSFEDVIVQWERAGSWTPQWVTLRNLVQLLERVGACEEASVLHGATTAPRTGAPPFGPDKERARERAHRLRADLGDDAFARCTKRGAELEDTEVVEFALHAVRGLINEIA